MFVFDLREQVRSMADAGMTASAIALDLRIARSTVDYHLHHPTQAQPPTRPAIQLPLTNALTESTRAQVARLLDAGWSRASIASEVGVTVPTVSYHARRLGAHIDDRAARRYDWPEIQRQYDAGLSMRECRERFGFSSQTWHAAVQRGALVPRPIETRVEELFANGTQRDRTNLKRRLFAAGLKQPHCDTCGIDRWRGAPLSLQLHHVNGDRFDNRVENLEVLCPNCHSLTDTYGGRGKGSATGGARVQ